jgi:Ca2+/Na+ antiporter
VKEKEIEDELVSIRSMMERSSKFISLSGLSGILAGVYALIGAAFAYYILYYNIHDEINPYNSVPGEFKADTPGIEKGPFFGYGTSIIAGLLLIAFLVLLASIGTGIFLSMRKAKRNKQPIWSSTSRQLLFNMAVPLASGGALVLVHVFRGHYGLIAPSCLVFYGLSLVAASNFTFTDVKYLGLSEIIIGLIAACLPGYGLLFWAIGFGLLHIVYGSMMYFKYDR